MVHSKPHKIRLTINSSRKFLFEVLTKLARSIIWRCKGTLPVPEPWFGTTSEPGPVCAVYKVKRLQTSSSDSLSPGQSKWKHETILCCDNKSTERKVLRNNKEKTTATPIHGLLWKQGRDMERWRGREFQSFNKCQPSFLPVHPPWADVVPWCDAFSPPGVFEASDLCLAEALRRWPSWRRPENPAGNCCRNCCSKKWEKTICQNVYGHWRHCEKWNLAGSRHCSAFKGTGEGGWGGGILTAVGLPNWETHLQLVVRFA